MKRSQWIGVFVWVFFTATMLVIVFTMARSREKFRREIKERSTQVHGEVVGWARDQVERRVGPAWEQGPSVDDPWFDAVDPELHRTLDALCTWVRRSPAWAAAAEDGRDLILRQETPYYTVWEAGKLLGVLEMHAERQVGYFDFPDHRERFDELDAEIQELIRI